MNSSQLYGGAEECHSSESGWTMYLSSPRHGDDDDQQGDDGDNEDDHGGGDGKNYYQEDDSDDSMASDASSGPSHLAASHFKDKQDDDDDDEEEKKHKKRNEKRKTERMRSKEEKGEVGFNARRTKKATATQAGAKQQDLSWACNLDQKRKIASKLAIAARYMMFLR